MRAEDLWFQCQQSLLREDPPDKACVGWDGSVCKLKTLLCVHRVRWFSLLHFTVCSQGHVVLLTLFYCVFTGSCVSPYSILLCVHRVRWFSLLCFTVCSQGHVALLTQFYCVFTEPEGSPYSVLLCVHIVGVFTESCGSPHSILLCVHTVGVFTVMWLSLLHFTVCSQSWRVHSNVVVPTLFYCVFTESACSQSCGCPYSVLLCVHRVGVFTVMWLSLLCFTVCSQSHVVLPTLFYCVFTESCGSPYSVLLCVHRRSCSCSCASASIWSVPVMLYHT